MPFVKKIFRKKKSDDQEEEKSSKKGKKNGSKSRGSALKKIKKVFVGGSKKREPPKVKNRKAVYVDKPPPNMGSSFANIVALVNEEPNREGMRIPLRTARVTSEDVEKMQKAVDPVVVEVKKPDQALESDLETAKARRLIKKENDSTETCVEIINLSSPAEKKPPRRPQSRSRKIEETITEFEEVEGARPAEVHEKTKTAEMMMKSYPIINQNQPAHSLCQSLPGQPSPQQMITDGQEDLEPVASVHLAQIKEKVSSVRLSEQAVKKQPKAEEKEKTQELLLPVEATMESGLDAGDEDAEEAYKTAEEPGDDTC